jgi:hypothetical protein
MTRYIPGGHPSKISGDYPGSNNKIISINPFKIHINPWTADERRYNTDER